MRMDEALKMTPVWEASYPPGLRWEQSPPVTTLTAELDSALAQHGDRDFLEFAGHTVSFARFGAAVELAARGLHALGVKPGVHVALHLPNTPHYPIAFYAVQRAGGVVVNLSPLDAQREVAHKLEIGEATIVLTFASIADKLPHDRPGLRVVICGPGDFSAAPSPIPDDPAAPVPFASLLDPARARVGEWPSRSPDDLAVLQFTGGTTGLPKAAELTHANVTAASALFTEWRRPMLAADGRNRVITVLPLFHIFALTCILIPGVVNGDLLILKARWDTDDILDTIAALRPTTLLGVPTMFRAIVSHPRAPEVDFSCLGWCNSGGAPLPVELRDEFQRVTGAVLLEGWGMSETCSAGTCSPRHKAKFGSAGVPLPGVSVEIRSIDDPRVALPAGERGEVCIKGPNVTAGYYKQPEANAEAFVDGWFRTGDIGYFDDEGYIFLVDRRKDLIISSGFNVYPRLIEEAIYEFPGVEEVIVVGVPDAYRGESAKAFVKLRDGAEPFTLDALKAFLADKVGRHEMPTAVEFRAALPKTPVGKLWKKPLADEERAKAAAPARA
jgi:long-chain acyl-CoA synthetase